MSYTLMPYQAEVDAACTNAYNNGARVVMPVVSTGGGKTVIMGHRAHMHDGYGCSIAHRNELVGQMSVALTREGLRHDIIAPDGIIRQIVAMQLEECGKSFYDARARWKVAGVDTIIKRALDKTWLASVTEAHIDEGHHVLRDNKWGRAFALFPNARGLFPTASCIRADGKGLGSHAHGLVDAMVEGPDMRWLINNGFLTDYQVRGITTDDLDLDGIPITASGELDMVELRKRTKASRKIIGDVVNTYLKYARGKKGITFAVDVEHATQIAEAYNLAGVPARVVHSGTPTVERDLYMRQFRKGELLQLVNVDLFGEGVDVPAVEVVSMARKTESYGLYIQQFGRALRLLVSPVLRAAWHTYSPAQRLAHIADSTKPFAMILDHVGNVLRHGGPPDWRKEPWSLDARTKSRSRSDAVTIRICLNDMCQQPYERALLECPYCGTVPPMPADRSRPEFVDGDVTLYTQELMQELFGRKEAIERVEPAVDPNWPAHIIAGQTNIHNANRASQFLLRQAMELYSPPGVDKRVNDKRFFLTFGVDTLTAQGLSSRQAEELRQRILTKVKGDK